MGQRVPFIIPLKSDIRFNLDKRYSTSVSISKKENIVLLSQEPIEIGFVTPELITKTGSFTYEEVNPPELVWSADPKDWISTLYCEDMELLANVDIGTIHEGLELENESLVVRLSTEIGLYRYGECAFTLGDLDGEHLRDMDQRTLWEFERMYASLMVLKNHTLALTEE